MKCLQISETPLSRAGKSLLQYISKKIKTVTSTPGD